MLALLVIKKIEKFRPGAGFSSMISVWGFSKECVYYYYVLQPEQAILLVRKLGIVSFHGNVH